MQDKKPNKPRWGSTSIMTIASPHLSIDRDAVSAFCRRHHITRLALFGSVLQDDFSPDKTAGLSRKAYDADEHLRLALVHLVQI